MALRERPQPATKQSTVNNHIEMFRKQSKEQGPKQGETRGDVRDIQPRETGTGQDSSIFSIAWQTVFLSTSNFLPFDLPIG